MSEYGWSLEYTLELGLPRALLLHTMIALRHGWTFAEMSYTDMEI